MSGLSWRGWPRGARTLRGRRGGTAGVLSVVLLGGLLAGGGMAVLATGSAAGPPLPPGPSVHGMNATTRIARPPLEASSHTGPASWPAQGAGTASLAATLPPAGARQLAGLASDRVAVPGTPVFLRPASATRPGPTRVAVSVAPHAAAQRLGMSGVVFSAAARQGSGELTVGLDYKSFAAAYGGNYGSRLRLVELPACALTTPRAPGCATQRPVSAAVNQAGQQSVTATVSLPATGQAMVLAATSTTYTTGNSDGGDGGGAAGSYTATALKPDGSWSSGGSGGDFTYSYPVTVPPAASSMAPSIALSYDSGSLDGQTAATQAQASWLGDGWSTPDNYIEQSFVSCADDPEGSAATSATNDECYDGNVLTLSLNGQSTSIVADTSGGTTKYVLQDDNGDTVTKVTGSGNISATLVKDQSYWVITDRSGTSYYFGRNELPGWASGDKTTNSIDYEPVYSAHSGDPCYTTAVCPTAYRWHLDYVTDIHGNAMAYYYQQATNSYLEDAATSYTSMPNADATYVRDSYLDHIDYGFTAGNAYSVNSGHAPDQVAFITGTRCSPTATSCPAISSSNSGSATSDYPDVPYDLACTSGSACLIPDPTFWSTVSLAAITTQQWNGTAYVPVDKWTFKQAMPGTGDGSSPTLFLSSISHEGDDTTAGGTAASVPNVTFGGDSTGRLDNRVDASASFPALTRQRITTITTETGSAIQVSYELASACTSADQANPSGNTGSCYPVWWTPVGQPLQKDWFNKYQVATVTQSDQTGGDNNLDELSTSYKYVGGAAWHYDDNELVKPAYRTYGQYRGFADVQTFTGAGNDQQTESETAYYRGMSDDNNTTAVPLRDSVGGSHDDTNQLAGEPLETTSHDFSGGPVTGSTIYSYWVSAAAATRTRSGLPALTANATGQVEAFTRTALNPGPSATWRDTETDTSYYAGLTSPYFGLAQYTYAHGDLSRTDDSQVRCTVNTYEPQSASGNLVGLVAQVETVAEPCGGTSPAGSSAPSSAQVNALTAPAAPADDTSIVGDTCTIYDDPTLAQTWPQATSTSCPTAAPTKGDISEVLKASGYSGGTFTYQPQSAAVYDSVGRLTASYNGNGNKTQTAYTANAYGLTTGITTTNPLGQVSSVTLDPLRGLTVATSDINKITTATHYDGLGRTIAEWGDSRDATTTSANATFTYAVPGNAPSAVTTNVLNDGGGHATSTTLYDALLRVRQTQDPTPQGGRLVTDTLYDSRGWEAKVNTAWWDSAPADTPSTSLAEVSGGIIPDSQVPNQTDTTYDGLGRPVLTDSRRDNVTRSQTATVYDQAVSDTATSDGDGTITVPLNAAGQPFAGAPATETVTDALGRTIQLRQYTTLPTVTVTSSQATPSSPYTTTVTASGGATQATDYGFDAVGDQTTVTDEATLSGTAQTWTSTYNMLGQVISRQDPDSGTTSGMNYDADGNLLQSTSSLGKTLSYKYDALDRKTFEFDAATSAQAGSNELASWAYDNSNGAVASMANPNGHLTTATSYTGGTSGSAYTEQAGGFSVFGGPTLETVTIPSSEGALAGAYKEAHTYLSISGLPLKDTYQANGTLPAENVTHGYGDAHGLYLPTGLTGLDGYEANITWTAWDQPGINEIGNATATANITSTYDDHTGALTDASLKNTAAGSATLDDTSYTYDAAGNPTGQTETRNGTTSETQCFAYDTLDRLSEAWTATDNCAADPSGNSGSTVGDGISGAGYWTSWTFSPLGQRETETDHGPNGTAGTTTQYNYNGNGKNQPDTLTSTASTGAAPGSSSSQYDAAGDVTSRSVTAGSTTTTEQLNWNDDGTLGQVVSNPGTGNSATSSYVYDASGSLLLQKDAATGTQDATTTLYLPGEQLMLDTKTGTITGDRFLALPGGGQVVRTGADTTSGTPGYYYQLSDQHGTATLAVGPALTAAQATWREFTPYGAPRGTTVTWIDNRGFLGKPADTVTGLTNVGARWYDPATGTFQSIDPVFEATSPQQHNGYTYAAGNPAAGSDPTGLQTLPCDGQCGTAGNGTANTGDGGSGGSGGTAGTNDGGSGTANTSDGGAGRQVSLDVWVPARYYTAMNRLWQKAMSNLPGGERYALGSPSTEAEAEFTIWAESCSEAPRACPKAFAKEARALSFQGMVAELPLALALSGDGLSRGGVGGDPGPFGPLAGDLATVQREDGVIIGGGLSCGGASFAPGTKVLLATGKTIPIASLKPGDKVLATNTTTGKTTPETVTAVEVNHDHDLYNLHVKTPHGTQVIHTTSNHLFWDPYHHYWVPANKLSNGEHLLTADGTVATADGGTTPKDHDGWMWDITVPGNNDHDFYVLAAAARQSASKHGYDPVAGSTPILVHNAPPGACSLTSATDAPPINSKTLFTNTNRTMRVDLENQNPGQPGAGIHVQFMGRGADPNKYYYDPTNGGWVTENGDILSPRIARQIPQSVISRAYQFLGLEAP